MSQATRVLHHEQPFEMYRGGILKRVDIAFETLGTLNPERDNAVLVFTGLSPSAHIASHAGDCSPGWWEDMVGPEHPIDTKRFFVICINSLGSCFGSSGPASVDLETGQRYGTDFPILSLEDIAQGGDAVVNSLGIESLAAVVGPSMGGMTALAYSIAYPDKVKNFVSVSSAVRALPFGIAIRSLQREIIRKDPAWQAGRYQDAGPVSGMRLARKLGMMSYRSPEEWKQRFGRERVAAERGAGEQFGIEFEIESYLEAHANKFGGSFDPNCYLYLSRAMDLFDAADHGGSLESAISRMQADQALVVGVESDFLFPLEQQEELAGMLETRVRKVHFAPLPSMHGHDSFLVDMDRFRPVIARFFSTI